MENKIIQMNTPVTDLRRVIEFGEELINFGKMLDSNEQHIEKALNMLRRQDVCSRFLTLEDVSKALGCQTIKATTKYLRDNNIEIIKAGKECRVYAESFYKIFNDNERC